MQQAVGAPLPPPHGQGQSKPAEWPSPQGPQPPSHHPSRLAPQGPPPAGHHPGPPAPQGPPPAGRDSRLPVPQGPPAGHHPGPPSAQGPASSGHPQGPAAPGWGRSVPHASAASPGRDTTGHIPLPPGGPVPIPAAPAGPTHADTGGTMLAVLLIGPAGAGKTTVAKHWARSRQVPTAHISLDDVREWVCSGFADPQAGWNDHSEAQYRLARRTCGFAARNFLANGISCILDDAVFPDRPVVGLGGWKRHVGPGLLPVVLLPGLEIVLERNAERSGNRRLSDEEVARIHGRMAGWYGSGLPIIDNSKYDVETTARVLDDVLARAIASPPSW
ncbi:ATP-binding protein [Streptomyces sp. A3M-1-3]|uniref:AAA family ATPase n=1 Tax=Streptomyces sp. A3M-1-3 TaxID=2962044 RepID=UPI0020B680C1|nr:AAA family ATPase [Streptomyces sp. A3M-1-3]MCP3817047.1 ATP-binding protein [Streptomyces sp. A3M-1-3]